MPPVQISRLAVGVRETAVLKHIPSINGIPGWKNGILGRSYFFLSYI